MRNGRHAVRRKMLCGGKLGKMLETVRGGKTSGRVSYMGWGFGYMDIFPSLPSVKHSQGLVGSLARVKIVKH